ncbi:homoserine dehydrogenase-domain-containing protein [Pelagophyceae sp. CCMP2097]|nr:homoserine dehydrogenase-domain-containing protein [Pelagophyceae sp. CCMP2097]
MAAKMNVGIVGGGVVGGGVYSILTEKFGDVVSVPKIAVRDLSKPRDFPLLPGTTLTANWEDVVNDPSIQCIVEVMGGLGAAKQCMLAALAKGKHVVTANKALLAACCDEVCAATAAGGGTLGFEAAVCGGIPIIATLQQHLAGDDIFSVRGIMNGTTNFMLSKMEFEGAGYDDVLAEAQALGFAESDPTADVEGHDVQAKIALLAKLAFGQTVPFDQVPTSGISKLGAVDFEYAKLLGATVKLLGTASLDRKTGELCVYVAPHIVPSAHVSGFAACRGAMNAVALETKHLGTASLVGPGAGRYPTARSIVADVIRAARGGATVPFPAAAGAAKLTFNPDYVSKFYVRITAKDQVGIIRMVGAAAEQRGVSIDAVLQNPINDPTNIEFVVTTGLARHSAVAAFCADIAALPFAKQPPVLAGMLC